MVPGARIELTLSGYEPPILTIELSWNGSPDFLEELLNREVFYVSTTTYCLLIRQANNGALDRTRTYARRSFVDSRSIQLSYKGIGGHCWICTNVGLMSHQICSLAPSAARTSAHEDKF